MCVNELKKRRDSITARHGNKRETNRQKTKSNDRIKNTTD